MQKRTEKVMKITIIPETGSPEKSTYISFRESSEIYQAINKLISRKDIYTINAWYRNGDNKDFTTHEVIAESPQKAVDCLSSRLTYYYFAYDIDGINYKPSGLTKNEIFNIAKP